MLTYVFGGATVTFMGLWLLETWRHAQTRRKLALDTKIRNAKLANAMIGLRHAFVSDVYKSDDLPRDQLLKQALDGADILERCEMLARKLTTTNQLTAEPSGIEPLMDEIQQLLARCGGFSDPFFRDTCLFYLAGVLEVGGRSDEAQLLRNALKHGTLRAKALQSHHLLLKISPSRRPAPPPPASVPLPRSTGRS